MNRIEQLIELVKPYYTSPDPAHDWAHVQRVAATAKKICDAQSVSTECVLAGVYCHDMVNLPKDHPDRKNASSLSAIKAVALLIQCGFLDDEIAIIQKAIIEHSFSKGLKPSCLEAAIVQDADRLDALGAIGILRCASVNSQMKSTFYEPLDPLARERELNDKKYMLDHYFIKLFTLPELMNTPEARSMAAERIQFMRSFLDELMKEIK